jgi:hypothetical protein
VQADMQDKAHGSGGSDQGFSNREPRPAMNSDGAKGEVRYW